MTSSFLLMTIRNQLALIFEELHGKVVREFAVRFFL